MKSPRYFIYRAEFVRERLSARENMLGKCLQICFRVPYHRCRSYRFLCRRTVFDLQRRCQVTMANILEEPLHFPTSGRTAKNRFLKAALSERLAQWDSLKSSSNGVPTERLINTYDKWGHGGWGIILTGNAIVDANHLEGAGNMIIEKSADSPWRREAFKKLANAAKSDGALVMVQLSHGGRQTPIAINEHPFSASDVRLTGGAMGANFGQPIPLTTEQIKTEVVEKFAYAAKFCADVGFDGVELHAAHGYLLSQFLSPTTNKRTDEYGGSVENRMRIIGEVYEAIRKLVPKDFVIGIKLNSAEFQKDGLSTPDAATISVGLEKLGFDFIELSGGTYERFEWRHLRESTVHREAYFIEFSEAIVKNLHKIIVYLTGGFRTTRGMCDAIEKGATNGIGIGRPSTQEPDLAAKLTQGKTIAAVKTLIHPDDFTLALYAYQTQMGQMGNEPFSGDVCKGIMDLSDKQTVEKYTAVLKKYMQDWGERMMKGEPMRGVCEF
uniref:Choline/carnitine acyltransferase domain-containing protein n=1 Tax=Parascaris univalens TaxID=6257 RepID=A0A915ATH5_PARUN